MSVPTSGGVSCRLNGAVGLVEWSRGAENFFDLAMIEQIADALERLDENPHCRAVVLASQGRCFCAGGRLLAEADDVHSPLAGAGKDNPLYLAAVRMFRIRKPMVAAVHGAAVGGGLGLALVADFRVASPRARFAANFVKLGIHPGFGLSHTLPRLIGVQKAHLMFMTGRRIPAEQALQWGLVDQLVPDEQLRSSALALAEEIAAGAPLAVESTRKTQRAQLAEAVLQITRHEFAEQRRLAETADFREGLEAVAQRRPGRFVGA